LTDQVTTDQCPSKCVHQSLYPGKIKYPVECSRGPHPEQLGRIHGDSPISDSGWLVCQPPPLSAVSFTSDNT